MKLLAIDDLEDNLISLSAMLRAYLPDCEVKTVRSGMAGLELARTWQPDTILLDIQMPGMDGFQVCQALKNYTPTKHIPIIFLTAARTDPASHVRGLELGGDAFLTKPFEPVELTAQVRAMVRIKVAEDALRTDKQGLEQMVAERTAALQAQTTQLDAIFDASPVAMLVLDEKTNVVRLNAAAAALGTSHSVSTHPPRPGEALGCVHATEDSRGCGYAPDCQLCQVRQELEKVLAGGAVVRGAEMELELVRQGRPQRVWFRVGAETITIAGRPHIVVALEDVSARHRDAAALLESEEKYRLLVEHAHEAIFVVRSGIIKFANAKCGELVGVPAAALVGRSALEWALPEERAELEASQLRMQRGEIYNTQAERRMVTRDGSIRWLAINAVPFTWQGEPATLNFATDTTAHKRAEAAVQREQRFANRLLDSLPGIFYLYTYPDLRLVQWNKNHETALGYGPGELADFHITDWHQPEARPAVLQAVEVVMEKGSIVIEAPLRAKDGRMIPFILTGQRFDDQGQLYMMGVGVDITETKRTANLLSLVINNIPDFVFWKDRNSVFQGCNNAFARAVGMGTPDQVVGKTDHDFSSKPEEADFFIATDRQVMASGEGQYHIVEPHLQADGKQAWIETSKVPLRDEKGEVVGVLGTFIDITERRATEQALRIKNLVFHASLSAKSIAGTDGIINEVNDSFLRTWGYPSREEAIGKPISHFLNDPAEMAAIRAALDQTGQWEGSYIARRWDGSTFIAQAMATVVRDDQGQTIGYQASVLDGTERRQAEQQLRESESRFRTIFGESPIAIWEEDFSAAQTRFAELRQAGVKDFSAYFAQHPEEVSALVKQVRVLAVNQRSVELLGAQSAENLPKDLARYFTEDSLLKFAEELAALAAGQSTYRTEIKVVNAKAEERLLDLTLSVPPDHAHDLSRVLVSFVDVTERKRAEATLKVTNERLLLATHAGNVGIWEWDTVTNGLVWDERMFQLYGVAKEQFSGAYAAWEQGVHPEDRPEQLANLQRILAGDDFDYDTEFRVIWPDQSVHYIKANGLVQRDAAGRPVRMLGTNWDITERKQAEERLTKSLAVLNETGKTAKVGGWELDVTTGIPTWTEETFRIFEIDLTQAEPPLPEGLSSYAPASQPIIAQAVQRAIEHGEAYDLELELITRSGNHRWVRTNGRAHQENGQTKRLSGAIQDITERKQAELALRETLEQLRLSEENLAVTLHSIGDAVIATDTRGRITRMNATAERLTGWPLAEAAGRPLPEVFRVVNTRTRAPALNPAQLVMERGEVVGLANHTALLARDGQEYQIADSAAPIRNSAGQIMGVVLVFSDVTESYRVQQELAATAELLERTGALAKVGGWELDLRTRLLYWSQETCRISEVDHPYVSAGVEAAMNFYAPEARPLVQAAVQAAMDHGTPYDLELPYITAKGCHLWVRTKGSAVRQDGQVVKLVGTFQDITERKQAEEALRLSEQAALSNNALLRSIMESPQDVVIFALDTAYRYTTFTQAHQRTMRSLWGTEITLGSSLLDAITTPDDRAKAQRNFDRALAGEHCVEDEYYGDPALSRRFYEDRYSPIRDHTGAVTGLTVFVTDITERRQAEEALRESHELFSLFMQHSPIYTYIKEVTPTENRVLQASENFQQMIGRSGAEMAGKSTAELFPADLAAKIAADDLAVVTSGGVLKLEETLHGRHYATIKFPMVQAGRTLVAGYTIDITERREAEDALRFSQFALDHISDAVFWITADARFAYVNEAACRKLGYTEAELLTMSVGDVDKDYTPEFWKGHWQQLCQTGALTIDTSHCAKDGKSIPVEVVANYVEFANQAYNCAFARDISERKRTEEVTAFLAGTGAGRSEEPFFPTLVRYLAECLRMDVVCIDRLGSDGLTVQTLAIWCDGKLDSNMTYALQDTPCGELLGQPFVCFPERIVQLFPRDLLLREMRAESYAGVTLFSHTGQPIGLITAIGRHPVTNQAQIETVLKLVALRAAAEVERSEAEMALRASEERFRHVSKVTSDVAYSCRDNEAGEFVIDWMTGATDRITGYTNEEIKAQGCWRFMVIQDDLEQFREQVMGLTPGEQGSSELRLRHRNGNLVWIASFAECAADPQNPERHRIYGGWDDITERKRLEAALANRIVALTRPLDQPDGITFDALFDLATIQRIQDEFAAATGVASIITQPDGTPITRPSNFCRLCRDIIRCTEKGLRNCYHSDAELGRHHPDGPIIQPCLSGGLWDAGASITVGDRHIANWLIGQVRDETQSEDKMLAYARAIGADEAAVSAAFKEVPAMSHERFQQIAQALFTLANQLSTTAYQNVQQARFITERQRAEAALLRREILLSAAAQVGRLLLAEHDVRKALVGVIRLMGEASGQDRAYIFEQHPDAATGATLMSQRFEWVAEGVTAEMANPELQDIPFAAVVPYLYTRLSRGLVVCEHVRDLPGSERAVLAAQGIVSVLLVPIEVASHFWGFIGFDKCRAEYDWSAGEQAALTTVAAAIGGALERQQVAAALQARDAKHGRILANIGDVIVVIDEAGINRYKSPNIEKWFGWRPEEVVGASTLENVHPEDRDEAREFIASLMSQPDTVATTECRYRCKNGSYKWIEFTGTNLLHDPEIRGLLGNYHDITDRKQAAVALSHSHGLMRYVIEHNRSAIAVHDRDLNYVYVSQSYLRAFNLAGQDVIGRHHYEVFPDLPQKWREVHQRALVGEISSAEEDAYDRADGSVVWTRWECRPWYAADGSIGGIIIYTEDITKRKQVEAELRASEEKYRFLIECSSDAIFCVDAEGRYVFTNRLFASTLGHTPEYFVGKTFWDVYPKAHADHRFEATKRVFQTGQSESLEVEVPIAGQTLHFYATANPIRDETGKVVLALTNATNITKLKEATAAQREAEWKFRALFELGPIGVAYHEMIYDAAGKPVDYRFLDANQSYLELTGVDPRGKTVLEAFPGIEKDEFDWIGTFGRVAKTGEPMRVEKFLQLNQQWYDLVAYQYRPDHFVAAFLNITKRKLAEDALRENEERFRSYIDHAPAGVFITDANGRYLQVNPAAARITGYTMEELLARRIPDMLPPESLDAASDHFQRAVLTGEASGEFAFRYKDGSTGYWQVDAVKLSPTRYLGFAIETTQRKITENALRESESRFRAVLETVSLIGVMLNLEGRITLANDFLLTLTGWQREEVLGQEWFGMFLPPEIRGSIRKDVFLMNAASGTVPPHFENEIITRSGERRLIAWNNTVLRDPAGAVLGTASIGEDITVRRSAALALQASLREKESLLKEIHHRVKNNLQIISSLLRLQSSQIDNDVAKGALKDMQNRVRSMALIHEHLYRSENLAQVDLGTYLKGLCQQLARAMIGLPGSVQLQLELTPIRVDIDQAIPCGLIVNELVSNCLKHAFPEGGRGTIRVELQPVAGSSQVCLRVSDNGAGLPEDFAVKRTKSLGLQLVTDLARQIEGKLEFNPAASAIAPPAATEATPAEAGAGPGAVFELTFKPASSHGPTPAASAASPP